MPNEIAKGFDPWIITLPIDCVVPTRVITDKVRSGRKFKRIRTSLAEVGLVEPLVVAPAQQGKHLLLDGHSRLAILRENGAAQVHCLVATDDEAFTYNKRVSHLATIQEHRMIVRALERGVPEQRMATTLNVDVGHIRQLRTLLDGICAEAVELLKDKQINTRVFRLMRRMKPLRQIEVAELMVAAGNYTASYAELLLVGTNQRHLLHPEKPKKVGGLSAEQIAKMERELETVSTDFRNAEEAYGRNVFDLVLARAYVGKLLRNEEVMRFLARNHPDIHEGFKSIVSEAPFEALRDAP